MQYLQYRHVLALIAVLGVVAPGPECQASDVAIESLGVGFDGTYKVGHWTPVRVRVAAGTAPVQGEISIRTSDCDGIPTRYPVAEPIHLAAGEQRTVEGCVKFGRAGGGVSVEFVAQDGATTERTFHSGEVPAGQLSSARLLVAVGGSVGLAEVARELPHDRPVVVAELDSAEELPEHWCAYEGVDAVVLCTGEPEVAASVTPAQFAALDQWLHLGGKIVFCVGANGPTFLGGAEPWSAWSPGKFAGVFDQTGVAGIESFVGSSSRLQPFKMTLLEEVRGGVQTRTGVGREYPVVIRTFRGFGQLVTVTCDLERPPFSEWPDRATLLARILEPKTERTRRTPGEQHSAQVVHVGYDDLVGQLRGALDRFRGVTRVAFAPIAVLIAVYALLVGPGDYFLIRYLARKMHWSWLSFSFQVLAFCGLAFFLFVQLRERSLQLNQIDLVDVDLESGWTRGTTWAHLYSPTTETYDLALRPLSLGSGGRSEPILSWQGLPGSGLGGLNSVASATLFDAPFDTPYSIEAQPDPTRPGSPASQAPVSIGNMPVPIGSTKSLTARWSARATRSESRLVTGSNDRLEGEIHNPLTVDLGSPVLIFSNWVYPLPGTLQAGQRMPIRRLEPKNLTWRLQRRRVIEMRDFGTPWDPADVLDLPRIVEMMMFHEAAGGKSYTRLSHDYQSYIDLTQHIQADRAVLLGRCEKPASELTRDGVSLDAHYDQRWTYVRILFPVDKGQVEAPAGRRR